EPFGEETLGQLGIGVRNKCETLPDAERRLHRIAQPGAIGLGLSPAADDEAVDHHLEGVLLHLVEDDVLREVADEAVDANAGEAAPPRRDEQLLVLALPVADERAEDQEPRALRVALDLVDDLLHVLRDD